MSSETGKNRRYLKQVVVVRKDLGMPVGKLAAMVAHAAMTFILHVWSTTKMFTEDQWRWLTDTDPGLEEVGQVSMAKIVCAADDEAHLLAVEQAAKDAGLTVHRVIDSGYSHNPAGTLTCIAIGPDYPERLDPVTGKLRIYK